MPRIRQPRVAATPAPAKAEIMRIEDLEPMYTVNAVAEHFGVNPFTVYHWKSIGLIDCKKQGRDVRFLARHIAECRELREKIASGETTLEAIREMRRLQKEGLRNG
jgi:DNA-binding transcriptional MerR regulator